MNIVGKILVFAIFIMSLVFMSLAVAVYVTHTDWEAESKRLSDVLAQEKAKRATLIEDINSLTMQVATSEAERDQVVAKLQYAIAEKDRVLQDLQGKKDELEKERQSAIAEMNSATAQLKLSTVEVEKLRAEIREQQIKVDQQIGKSVELSAKLHEKESLLAIVEERKGQLEKQLANARVLLKQSGLAIDSLPRDQVPTVDGVVTAVAEGAVEVSLGGDDGLQMGHVLELYRDGVYLGRAVVKAVKPDRSVAVIVKEYAKGTVQRGDRVTTRLKPA